MSSPLVLSELIIGLLGDEALIDVDLAEPHGRYEAFGRAVRLASVDALGDLLDCLDAEPDPLLRRAMVVDVLDDAARRIGSKASFEAWVTHHSVALGASDFVAQRAAGWILRKALAEGEPVVLADVQSSSNWLQLQLAQESIDADVLGRLARLGRTKRIRAAANERLRTFHQA